jgi:hypothetical protein
VRKKGNFTVLTIDEDFSKHLSIAFLLMKSGKNQPLADFDGYIPKSYLTFPDLLFLSVYYAITPESFKPLGAIQNL